MKISNFISIENISSELSAALVATLVFFLRKSIVSFFSTSFSLIKKFMEKIYLFGLYSHLNEIKQELIRIQSELKPNGGSSLRDAVNKIDKKIDDISCKVIKMSVETDISSDLFRICRWSSDENGYFSFVNRSFKELTGVFDDSRCLGNSWISNIVFIEDRNTVREEWDRSIKSKSEYHHTFRICNLTTNDIIKVTSHGKPVFDDKHNLLGWVGVFIRHPPE